MPAQILIPSHDCIRTTASSPENICNPNADLPVVNSIETAGFISTKARPVCHIFAQLAGKYRPLVK